MADLRVELYGYLVGHLVGTDWRTFAFRAEPSAFARFELGSTVLSESVPLDLVSNRSHAARRRNYFAELLPEGRILTNLARQARVSESDVIGLLARYGRDVAGAVQIYDPDRPGEPKTPRTERMSESELEMLLLDGVESPLGNQFDSGKSSLAGVQDKIVLARIDDDWHRVHDGYPSTHIIKPESSGFPTVIFDEEYGCRLAASLGLASHNTAIARFGSVAALVVERYDRSPDLPQGRVHQEDMNQALGARGNEKYQELGGKVSLKRVARLLTKNHDDDSLRRLLCLTTLSVAIGNLDMHTKNISLLHYPDSSSTIAPAYDVVPMRHLPNDGRMALSINAKYIHAQITKSDLVEEARGWGLQTSGPIVDSTLEAIAELLDHQVPHEQAYHHLARDIATFTRNLLDGKPAGDPG